MNYRAILAQAFALGAFAYPVTAQDIFLVRYGVEPSGRIRLQEPVNITNRPGYDNQPSFGPDIRSVFYTSTREDQQADIYRYDIQSRATTRLTSTAPESEYSASLMPKGQRFSVIRVERDSSQRLWSFALNGGDPQVVVPGIKPVGYHTWAGTSHLALYVLGSPNTLQLFDVSNARTDTITTGIGRSLQTVPPLGQATPGGIFSFVKREGSTFSLYTVDTRARPLQPKLITELPPGSEYVAWVSPTEVITGADSKLMLFNTATGATWSELADFSATLNRISRLSVGVGAGGLFIAIVAEPLGS